MENQFTEKNNWQHCKNILCVRADNIGDLLMSAPAINALKTTLDCKITVLTSVKAAGIAKLIPGIDQVITADLPWVKQDTDVGPESLQQLVQQISRNQYDGCVIFSVYSQNTLPSAMLAYLAGIPLCLAYSRENPYNLLSNWIPDPEPYFYISHQVERDLDLVRMIGAETTDKRLRLKLSAESFKSAKRKVVQLNIDLSKPYLILHAGVSEKKRRYPEHLWIEAGKLLIAELNMPILLTGSAQEVPFAQQLAEAIGQPASSVAGLFNLEEFASLISYSKIVVSVNTATIHLAAALNKPLVVLYAQTNPQHAPWMVKHKLLEYSVPDELKSKNQVIRYVNEQYYISTIPFPSAKAIATAVKELLQSEK